MSYKFPEKEFQAIFPLAKGKDVAHFLKDKGKWERENILWIWGEARKEDYPEEWKRLKPKLDRWAMHQKIRKVM